MDGPQARLLHQPSKLPPGFTKTLTVTPEIELVLLQNNPSRFQSLDFPDLDQFKIDLASEGVDADDFDADGIAEAEFAAVAAVFDNVFLVVGIVIG